MATSIVALASMTWSPALICQAEVRAYHLNQIRDVPVLVPIISGTIDEGVLKLQGTKRTTKEEVTEAAKTALPTAQRPKLVEVPSEVVAG